MFFKINVTWQKFVFFENFENCNKVKMQNKNVIIITTNIEITENIKLCKNFKSI